MDDCPITFFHNPSLQLNPEFSSGTWTQPGVSTLIAMVFDSVMDQTVAPAISSWQVKVDGGVKAVGSNNWVDSKTLVLDVFGPLPPSVDVTVELLVEDSDLHALAGANVLPFGPETIPAA